MNKWDELVKAHRELQKLVETLVEKHLILEERVNLQHETIAIQAQSLCIARECIEMLASRIGLADVEVQH